MPGYTVSKDPKSGMWYAHMKGFAYVPIFGSFCEKKSDAMEYAKMYNGFPHRIQAIDNRRESERKKAVG